MTFLAESQGTFYTLLIGYWNGKKGKKKVKRLEKRENGVKMGFLGIFCFFFGSVVKV